jgi:hypothetical protein
MVDFTSHHPFTSSPTSTDAHSPNTTSPLRKHIGYSNQLSPNHFRTFHDALTFPKCAIQSSTTSTDTEFSSDYGVDFPQHARPPHMTSPSHSLLTSMIQTNNCASAATSRSSSTSQPVPLTPTSSTCGKPILRRDTSAPTSASEDNGLGVKGLGLAFTSCEIREEPTKRACSLKFAVRSPPSSSNRALSDSGHQINLSAARKPKSRTSRTIGFQEEDEDDLSSSHLGHHPTLAAPLEQDEEDDEDEGYQEDSEGGFTSEEEEDYFTAPSRGRGNRSFIPSYQPYPTSPRRRMSHSADQAVIYTSTNEDCPPPPVTRGPGRQVSIADMRMKFDHCSRHVSPPPLDLVRENGDGEDLAPAPPAAASPSARGLCRRRESSNIPPTNSARRQASLFGPPAEGSSSRPINRSTQSDDSAFFSGRCTSILKRDPSSDRSQGQVPLSPVLLFGDRRSSEPSQCQVDEQCANGSVSPVGSEGEGQTARQGLERCLGRC